MFLFQVKIEYSDSLLKKKAAEYGISVEQLKNSMKNLNKNYDTGIAETDQGKVNHINEKLKVILAVLNNKAKPEQLASDERKIYDFLKNFTELDFSGNTLAVKFSVLEVETYKPFEKSIYLRLYLTPAQGKGLAEVQIYARGSIESSAPKTILLPNYIYNEKNMTLFSLEAEAKKTPLGPEGDSKSP